MIADKYAKIWRKDRDKAIELTTRQQQLTMIPFKDFYKEHIQDPVFTLPTLGLFETHYFRRLDYVNGYLRERGAY